MFYSVYILYSTKWVRKRAQMTLDASFGLLVSFFYFFLSFSNTNICFVVYINILTDVLKSRGGSRKPALTITGPNDARRVVWAISKFF
jgi:hypothetical protein